MSDVSSVEPERKIKLENYYFQRRILFGCTVGLFFGILMWIIGMSTNRWFIVSGGDGIFVESHRRYFKSSHTGIWRYCRYALIPQPIDSNIIRNYTSFSAQGKFSKTVREKLISENFSKDFPLESLPADLNEITEITDTLKQHMYDAWLKGNDVKFNRLKAKFESLDEDEKVRIKNTEYVDPSERNLLSKVFGDLIFNVDYNKTHELHLVIPDDLKEALFDNWNNYGMDFVRMLSHYSRDLNIDPNIYVGDTKYIFQPPKPDKYQKKPRNGFIYVKWSTCKYHNLFANNEELAADPSVDEDLLDLSRTAASFSIVTIFVMILGFVFTVYTFLNPRYMFKRLAGGVHFISALSSVTVCKLMSACVLHAQDHLAFAFPKGSTFTYGFAFYFGCLVSMINFISFIMFFWYSKKQKGDQAATEELGIADEVIQMGR